MSSNAEGYLLVNKAPGVTSFDVLSPIKKAFGTGRVGHSGTLDKFAEGLLIVLVGRFTRLVPWFTGCDKTYRGVIEFGEETDTLDPEGKVIAKAEPPSQAALLNALPGFLGSQRQLPPMFSSVHINGKRAHELAREGVVIDLPSRPIEIYSLDLLEYKNSKAIIQVHCSKGTYIRSLARDIALKLDSRAHLSALERLKVGSFSITEAFKLDREKDCEKLCTTALRKIDRDTAERIGLAVFQIRSPFTRSILNGKPFDPGWTQPRCAENCNNKAMAVFDDEGNFLAIIERLNDSWRYGFVNVNNRAS